MKKEFIHNLINQYNKENNLLPITLIDNAHLSLEVSEKISISFENTKEDINNQELRKSYGYFIRELINQYKLLSNYIDFEYTSINPYENNSKLMFKDIEENNHLLVFIGGEYHPIMRETNKVFRAVHDIFGHYINNNSFSFLGEYKAYLHHRQTFSNEAKKALFTETIAQNSYYRINNKFSSQKTIILPKEIRLLA